MTVDVFLQELSHADLSRRHKIDVVYHILDDWCLAGQFARVDEVLQRLEPPALLTSVLLSILTVARPAAQGHQIQHYAAFFAKVQAHLREVDPTRQEKLLEGLAPPLK